MHGIRLPHLKKTIVRTNPMVMATTIPVSDSINESPVNKEKICPSPNVTEDTIIAIATLPSFSIALNRKPRKTNSSTKPTKAIETAAVIMAEPWQSGMNPPQKLPLVMIHNGMNHNRARLFSPHPSRPYFFRRPFLCFAGVCRSQ